MHWNKAVLNRCDVTIPKLCWHLWTAASSVNIHYMVQLVTRSCCHIAGWPSQPSLLFQADKRKRAKGCLVCCTERSCVNFLLCTSYKVESGATAYKIIWSKIHALWLRLQTIFKLSNILKESTLLYWEVTLYIILACAVSNLHWFLAHFILHLSCPWALQWSLVPTNMLALFFLFCHWACTFLSCWWIWCMHTPPAAVA